MRKDRVGEGGPALRVTHDAGSAVPARAAPTLTSAVLLIVATMAASTGSAQQAAISDRDLDACYAGWARRMNMQVTQLDAALAHAGMESAIIRTRVRAEMAQRRASDPRYCRF